MSEVVSSFNMKVLLPALSPFIIVDFPHQPHFKQFAMQRKYVLESLDLPHCC